MRPEEQCIAIAKACGWTEYQDGEGWHKPGETQPYLDPPEYLNDLNAMHEAEKTLDNEDRTTYIRLLNKGDFSYRRLAFATAAQRAKAFLRTLGLWKEGA